MEKIPVIGPTFEEMLHPWKIEETIRRTAWRKRTEDPLHPINLYNITWRDIDNHFYFFEVPHELTGIKANIVVMYAKDFPSESHKVGATYAILAEKTVTGEVDPAVHTLVWPSTGNYGIGGAWVGSRMNYDSVVLLPEKMSRERFEIIRSYGAKAVATPGCESNVKEIYDKSKELYNSDREHVRVLNQFEEFGNYRFHWYVTGNSMIELVRENKIGNQKIAAVVLGVGSAGTLASADRVKQEFADCKCVAMEPVQCPTVSLNGYGEHDIQGIGDKHVTWIHNVMNTDAVVLVDDTDSKKILKDFTDEAVFPYLVQTAGESNARMISQNFGISGVANLIAAIKTARFYNLGQDENILIIATDSIGRYRSVMQEMPAVTLESAVIDIERILLKQDTCGVYEGTRENRMRWHNLKYFTWVEQQNKTVAHLNAQKEQAYWREQQERTFETDKQIKEYRKSHETVLRKIMEY